MVTETCANGKERTFKKSVLSSPFRNGKHVVEEERIARGIEELKKHYYYNIQYLGTKHKHLLFLDE